MRLIGRDGHIAEDLPVAVGLFSPDGEVAARDWGGVREGGFGLAPFVDEVALLHGAWRHG